MSSSWVSKSVCSTLIVRKTSNVSFGTRISVRHGISGSLEEQKSSVLRSTLRLLEPVSAGHETQPDDLAESEYVPRPQMEHSNEPGSTPNDPAGHATHAPDPAES
eukprot:1603085-Rhodomonas_salina.1